MNDKKPTLVAWYSRIGLIQKPLIKHQLDPAKDPESLFCDTEFLERPTSKGGLGINVRKGKGCEKKG